VLWNGGISFGGVLAFVFADLIILPILDIYRRYYGRRMAGFLFVTFYGTMAAAGLVVEFAFQGLGLTPKGRHAKIETASVSLNYTTYLNIVFLVVAGLLLWRFFTTGGAQMLRTMNSGEATRQRASPVALFAVRGSRRWRARTTRSTRGRLRPTDA
jgi:uncharacterized membrane protein YraQ (UPF0718 family)